MRYMVLKHGRREHRHQNLWYVADMHHPQLHGKIVMKTLESAMWYCERMNRGTRYFDSKGCETVHEAMVRLYRTTMANGGSTRGLGTAHQQALEYFRERGGPPTRRMIRVE